MSDYLGNIAAKSLNIAQVVQPRPVSLFEPVHVEGMLGAGCRSSGGHIDGLSVSDQGETGEMRSIAAVSLQTQVYRPQADTLTDHSGPMKAPKSMKPEAQNPRHEANRVPQSPIEFSETVRDRESIRSPSQATSQQNQSEQQHLLTTNPLLTGEPHRHRVQPSIEHITPDQPRVPVSQRSMTTSFRTAESIPVQTSPGPTIQVSIGLVEVRATTPAASSQKHRPVPKTMSLDEYLGKRSGGRP